ncbi:hypothetical protein BSKO_06433 [Bryopsis sp. KO-2023]|nr:hypothetical protein BSKO_06433 [Bryopsis sp. KO-2023]
MSSDIYHYGIPVLTAVWPEGNVFVLGGGGGSAKTGIMNRVLLVKFEHGNLSDPLSEVDCNDEYPFRFALHPNSSDLVVGLGAKSAKHLKIESLEKADKANTKLVEVSEGETIEKLGAISEVISSLKFSQDGKLLCLGYERGWIQVFEWPEMKERVRCRDNVDFSSLNDIDVSPDSQTIATTSERGLCEFWSIEDGKLLNTLNKPSLRAPRYAHVRFHPASSSCRIYTTVNTGKDGGYLFKWSVGKNWKPKMICKRKVATEAVSSFAVSQRGDLLAIGNNVGDLLVVSGGGMYPLQKVKGAHMVFVTALVFQNENLDEVPGKTIGLLSASADHSARITHVQKKSELRAWLSAYAWLILLILLACLLIQLDRYASTTSTTKDEL